MNTQTNCPPALSITFSALIYLPTASNTTLLKHKPNWSLICLKASHIFALSSGRKKKKGKKKVNHFNFFANPCLWHIFLSSLCLHIPACIVVQSYGIICSLQNICFHIFPTIYICSDFFPGCFPTSLFA